MDNNTVWPGGVQYPTEKRSIATARRDMATFVASRTAWVHEASAAQSVGVWKPRPARESA